MLLSTLGLMALALLVDPARFIPPLGTPPRTATTPWAIAGLFAAGLYGGVLQAGAGLVFLALLAGGLRYDLIAANALKALVMMVYIAGTVVVFALADQVVWAPGLVLGVGAAVGAFIASQLAVDGAGRLEGADLARQLVGVEHALYHVVVPGPVDDAPGVLLANDPLGRGEHLEPDPALVLLELGDGVRSDHSGCAERSPVVTPRCIGS